MRFLRSMSLLLAPAVLLAGCASPGPPRPPSLELPEPATGLTAVRTGDSVQLSFVVSQRSTDGYTLPAPPRASLCRAVDEGPCVALAAYTTPVTLAVGGQTLRDLLPRELQDGLPHLLRYQLTLYNARGRTDGPSDPVFALSGPTPAAVHGLRAEGSRDGIVLHWDAETGHATGDVLLLREGGGTPAKSSAFAPPTQKARPREGLISHRKRPPAATPDKPVAASSTLVLRASAAGAASDVGGAVDGSAATDVPYTYTAVRSRTLTLAGHTLELRSAPSLAVVFVLHDTFAPDVPAGLTAAAFPLDDANLAVDLIWQPNAEPDLDGYLVFRQLVPPSSSSATPLAAERLTPTPVRTAGFSDRHLPRGVHVRYWVVAVDKKGNQSAASKPVDVP